MPNVLRGSSGKPDRSPLNHPHKDGQHFLGLTDAAATPSGSPFSAQIHVVLNWFEELKARVPVR